MRTGSTRNLLQALAALLAGNAAYFLMMPHLPPAIWHVPFRMDSGLVLDFVFCVIAFVASKRSCGFDVRRLLRPEIFRYDCQNRRMDR
jgi:hypothetical protein